MCNLVSVEVDLSNPSRLSSGTLDSMKLPPWSSGSVYRGKDEVLVWVDGTDPLHVSTNTAGVNKRKDTDDGRFPVLDDFNLVPSPVPSSVPDPVPVLITSPFTSVVSVVMLRGHVYLTLDGWGKEGPRVDGTTEEKYRSERRNGPVTNPDVTSILCFCGSHLVNLFPVLVFVHFCLYGNRVCKGLLTPFKRLPGQ